MPAVTVTGPFFTQGAKPVQQAIEDTIRDIVEQGEKVVKAQLYPGHGLITGHYRRSVIGEMQDSRHGRIHDSDVVYGPWLEGVSSRNQSSRFKGYAMFRNATQQLQRESGTILKKHLSRAMQRLN